MSFFFNLEKLNWCLFKILHFPFGNPTKTWQELSQSPLSKGLFMSEVIKITKSFRHSALRVHFPQGQETREAKSCVSEVAE